MAPPTKRKRPVLTVTVDADIKARLQAVAAKIPGGTVSGVVNELLRVAVPMVESVVQVMVDARQQDGSLDDEAARQGMAAWIGTTMLSLYDSQGKLDEGGKDST